MWNYQLPTERNESHHGYWEQTNGVLSCTFWNIFNGFQTFQVLIEYCIHDIVSEVNNKTFSRSGLLEQNTMRL